MTTTTTGAPCGEPGSWIRLPDGRPAQVWCAADPGPPVALELRVVTITSWLDDNRKHRPGALRWAVDADQGVHLVDLDELDAQPVSHDDLFGGAG